MLVITLKDKEGAMIGDQIRVIPVRTKKGQVRLGIHAPETVPIARDDAVTKANKIGPGCCPCCGMRLEIVREVS